MLKLENTDVYGWEAAIRGMRNPMNSWDMSDSRWGLAEGELDYDGKLAYYIGENDLKLMKNLSKAGNDHGKFLRMINVTVDITAPLYWWKEFDTYKVGTVANSCSTMHKIHAKEFELDDFSYEHLFDSDKEHISEEDWVDVSEDGSFVEQWDSVEFIKMIVRALNVYRERYLECAERLKHNTFETWNDGIACKADQKRYWWQMIQLLPSSYNQKRTVQLNYQVLKQMYFARRNHKLDEWHTLCEWVESLPYFKEICIDV